MLILIGPLSKPWYITLHLMHVFNPLYDNFGITLCFLCLVWEFEFLKGKNWKRLDQNKFHQGPNLVHWVQKTTHGLTYFFFGGGGQMDPNCDMEMFWGLSRFWPYHSKFVLNVIFNLIIYSYFIQRLSEMLQILDVKIRANINFNNFSGLRFIFLLKS